MRTTGGAIAVHLLLLLQQQLRSASAQVTCGDGTTQVANECVVVEPPPDHTLLIIVIVGVVVIIVLMIVAKCLKREKTKRENAKRREKAAARHEDAIEKVRKRTVRCALWMAKTERGLPQRNLKPLFLLGSRRAEGPSGDAMGSISDNGSSAPPYGRSEERDVAVRPVDHTSGRTFPLTTGCSSRTLLQWAATARHLSSCPT
eukprot:COSAG02_NODE_2793_length_8017_cov_6.303738_6_plen_202_part_00